MSNEKKKTNFFLCCFCGKKIQSNRFNLEQHEKLHSSLISKIKCAAKNCESSFANKSIYWRHWIDKHKGITMPDFLIYVDVPAPRARQAGKARLNNAMKKVNKVEATNMPMTTTMKAHTARNNSCKIDGENIEEAKDFLNFNIENIIEDCLIRDPFYGCCVVENPLEDFSLIV